MNEHLGTWPLGSFKAARHDGKVTTTLTLDFSGDRAQQLETMTSMANVRNLEVVDLVCASSPE